MNEVRLGDVAVGHGQRPYVIAEVGSNHNGDMELCRRLIDAAADAGADAVKFQSWSESSLIAREEYDRNLDYDDKKKHFGSLREMVRAYQLTREHHAQAKRWCDERGVAFCSSAFSTEEVDLLDELDVPFIKVASMDVTYLPLLRAVAETGRPVLLSTGMATLGEIERAVDVVRRSGNERSDQAGKRTFTLLSRWLVRRTAAVLLLSEEERRTWARVCPWARLEVVLNPYESRAVFPGRPIGGEGASRPPVMLFVGRLVRDKGIFELLDALRIVRRRHACRLVIAGRGPEEGDVRRRVAELGLDSAVDMRGYLTGDDLDSAYREAALFVLPSYREGFPLVVMEAMDHGLPIVTTPIRGCADHLEPGVNALFVPPRDAESLADALLRLLGDTAMRARMGAVNRLKVRDFAPEIVMPQYVDILRSAVNGNGRQAVTRTADGADGLTSDTACDPFVAGGNGGGDRTAEGPVDVVKARS